MSIARVYVGQLINSSREKQDIRVSASTRAEAVSLITKDIWKNAGKGNGTLKGNLIVLDSYKEVRYDENMKCNHALYSYLPDNVALRVVSESSGVIELNHDYPESGFQLIRIQKKDYKGKGKKGSGVKPVGARSETTGNISENVTTGHMGPRNIWEKSTILKSETGRGRKPVTTTICPVRLDERGMRHTAIEESSGGRRNGKPFMS